MNQLAQWILDFFAQIQEMGPVLFVPIIIFVTGLCFGLTWMKSSRAAITVGIGFIGVNLALTLVWDQLGPVTQDIVARFGLRLEVLDTSWTSAAAVSFTTQIGVVIIPYVLLINTLLLFLRLTKTLDIDIWNFWHFALSGSLVAVMSGSIFLGFLATACHVVIVLQFADITARQVQRELNIPGVSIPHGNSVALAPLYLALDKLYDQIPFLRLNKDKKDIGDRPFFKWLSDPIIMGFFIGWLLALLAGRDLLRCATTAMSMAALMLLLPRMVKVIMEGLIPISQCAKRFADGRMGGRVLYIGLDSAVTLGHPTTLSASMILIPITLLLAFILPGNRTIPVGDLVAISFFIAIATPIHKGSLARTLISGVITNSIMLLVCSYFAPAFTQLARQTGNLTVPSTATQISAMAVGDPVAWLLERASQVPYAGAFLMVGVTALIVVACRAYGQYCEKKEAEDRQMETQRADQQ